MVGARETSGVEECDALIAKCTNFDRRSTKLLEQLRDFVSKGLNSRNATTVIKPLVTNLLAHYKDSSESLLKLAKDQKNEDRKIVRTAFAILTLAIEHTVRISQEQQGMILLDTILNELESSGELRHQYLPRRAIALRVFTLLSVHLQKHERIKTALSPLLTSMTVIHKQQGDKQSKNRTTRKGLAGAKYLSPTVYSCLRFGVPSTIENLSLVHFGMHSNNSDTVRQTVSFACAAAQFQPVQVAHIIDEALQSGIQTENVESQTRRMKRLTIGKRRTNEIETQMNVSDTLAMMNLIRTCVSTLLLSASITPDQMIANQTEYQHLNTSSNASSSTEVHGHLYQIISDGLQDARPRVRLFTITQLIKFQWSHLREQRLESGDTLVESMVTVLLELWTISKPTSNLTKKGKSVAKQEQSNGSAESAEIGRIPVSDPILRHTWCSVVAIMMENCTRYNSESSTWRSAAAGDGTVPEHEESHVLRLLPHLSQLVHQNCVPPIASITRLLAIKAVVWLPGESSNHELRVLSQLESSLTESELTQVIGFVEARARVSPGFARVLLGYVTRSAQTGLDIVQVEKVMSILKSCTSIPDSKVKLLVLELIFTLLDGNLCGDNVQGAEDWKQNLFWFLGEYAFDFASVRVAPTVQPTEEYEFTLNCLPCHLLDIVKRLLNEVYTSTSWVQRRVAALAISRYALCVQEPYRIALYQTLIELQGSCQDTRSALGIWDVIEETVNILDDVYKSISNATFEDSQVQQHLVQTARLVHQRLPAEFLFR